MIVIVPLTVSMVWIAVSAFLAGVIAGWIGRGPIERRENKVQEHMWIVYRCPDERCSEVHAYRDDTDAFYRASMVVAALGLPCYCFTSLESNQDFIVQAKKDAFALEYPRGE